MGRKERKGNEVRIVGERPYLFVLSGRSRPDVTADHSGVVGIKVVLVLAGVATGNPNGRVAGKLARHGLVQFLRRQSNVGCLKHDK